MEKTPENLLTLGAVLGGIATRIASALFKKQLDEAAQIRKELREEIDQMHEQIKAVSADLDSWKHKYYALQEENILLRAKCRDLKAEIDDLRENFANPHGGS